MENIIVLDAMGVIYKACDDVEELLIPFIKENNNACDEIIIKNAYIRASLGIISAAQFWNECGIDESIESEYLKKYELSEGLTDWLATCSIHNKCICLSNDISDWSKKLREKFKLSKYIDDWFISGDLGYRKPDDQIYRIVENKYVRGSRFIFFDDNPRNVKIATDLGWDAYLFLLNRKISEKDNTFRIVRTFKEIEKILS